jgi:peroxiredoxin-like protein
MTPLPHHYEVALHADGDSAPGLLSAEGAPPLHVSAPRQYDGPGDQWTPEHLLLAAVEACFLMTFRAYARASHLPFAHLAITASGTVARDNGATRFTAIALRPVLTLAVEADRERAGHLLEKAEKACLVSASLATPIALDAQIAVA